MRWNLAVAGIAAAWGFISVIVAHVDLPASVLVFYRVALAASVLLAAAAALGRLELVRLPSSRWRAIALGAGLGLHWFLFFETVKLSSVAVAVLTVYTAPIFLALLAPVVLPERRSAVTLAALVPAATGLVLVALAGEQGAHARPLAIVVGLGAALTYALLVVGTKQLTAHLEPVTIAFWSYTVAGIVLAPLLVGANRVVPRWGEVGYLLLMGVVLTAGSGFLYVSLLRRVTAQAVGILAYVEPVSAAVLAWALLDQELGWAVIAGGTLIVAAGMAVVVYEPAAPAASPQSAPAEGVRGKPDVPPAPRHVT